MAEDVKKENATVGADDEQNQAGHTEETQEEEKIEMTQSELEQKLQAETDKRVNEALETHRSKWEKEVKQKIAKERADAERLAKLSAEEREKEEVKRNREELTQKEKDLQQREMKLAAIDILAEENLPVTFADQLIGEDVDDTYDRIKKFKKAWHDAVEAQVKEQLKGQIPSTGEQQPPKVDMNQRIRAMAGRK